MVRIEVLKECPSCGHDGFVSPLPSDVTYDNSLGRALARGKNWDFDGFDLGELRVTQWRVCAHCALIYCAKRPILDSDDKWYRSLFASLEHRDYDTHPLPDRYLQNQQSFSTELFDLLNDHGVFEGAESALHFRCNGGFLLRQMQEKTDVRDVYGLEYFEHPAAHAASLIGAENVSLIVTPEPQNPYERKTFDVILLEHFLTHAHHPREFLDYVISLLAPGGTLVVFNEQDHGKSLKEPERYPNGVNFFHKQLFKQKDMSALLRSRGLEARQLPHPAGRKWTTALHSMLFICQRGEMQPIPEGDVERTSKLYRSWWSSNRRHSRTRWITKPMKKLGKRLFRNDAAAPPP